MRVLRTAVVMILAFVSVGLGQQFYRSAGLDLFNQAQYKAAIDSLVQWADTYSADRGIVYYYIGESHYNLGLDANDLTTSAGAFEQALDYFTRAQQQTDLISQHSEKVSEAKVKVGWCHFRLAELSLNPSARLLQALQAFTDASASGSDTLSVHARYLAAECHLRIAETRRMGVLLSENPARVEDLAQQTIQHLQQARNLFNQVAGARTASVHLRTSARLRSRDLFIIWGGLYQTMPEDVFRTINDSEKQGMPIQTAVSLYSLTNYQRLLASLDRLSRVAFEPAIAYSRAFRMLSAYLVTGEDSDRHGLNVALDSLRWSLFQNDKMFLEASRDLRSPLIEDPFIRLSDTQRSLYARVAGQIPEAWYWLGWAQFIANVPDAEGQFRRFLQETGNIPRDARLTVLREDAQYRSLFLRFDQHAADQTVLRDLKGEIEAFSPSTPSLQIQVQLLLQLVRVGLNEPIWGAILQGATTEDRLQGAFILIRNMLVRASRVTGQERVPYLRYLDKLFEITQDRRSEGTVFYRGLARFLQAEIQETADTKRSYYTSAAEILGQTSGQYQREGLYVQARSYFAAAKHEFNDRRRRGMYERAKPLFEQLINVSKSLRSVYYLGEIFRIEGNDLAARRCYESVMARTQGTARGAFWFNNARAGLRSAGIRGDTTALNGIAIRGVEYPERLLVEDGEAISLERFADPDYVRRQYWQEALNMLVAFGLPKRDLYPSKFRLSGSRFNQRAFRTITAGISERIGTITSGIEIDVKLPDGVRRDLRVTLDGVPLDPGLRGTYEKSPLSLNQELLIRVENPSCYPFSERMRLTKPGVEQKRIFLSPRMTFTQEGMGVTAGTQMLQFPQRLDANQLLQVSGPPISRSTFIYRDFEKDVQYRDIAHTATLNAFLVVHSQKDQIQIYRTDDMMSFDRELPLVFEHESEALVSPEGIDVNARGDLYIVDWGRHQISVFRQDGTHIHSFGSLGINTPTDEGRQVRLTFPARIAVAEDREGVLVDGERLYRSPILFITDRNGIQITDVQGGYLGSIVPAGIQKGVLYDVAVRGYGPGMTIQVIDRHRGQVLRFTAQLSGNP